QRVGIYHRLVVNIGARVYKHRGHAGHAPPYKTAVAYRRASWNNSDAVFNCEMPGRICVLIKKVEMMADGKILDLAEPKPGHYSLFPPEVSTPLTVRFFGGAHFPRIELPLELIKYFVMLVGEFVRRACGQLLNLFCQAHNICNASNY